MIQPVINPYSSLPIETVMSQVVYEDSVAKVKVNDIHHSPLIHKPNRFIIEDNQTSFIFGTSMLAVPHHLSPCLQKQPLLEMICLLQIGEIFALKLSGIFFDIHDLSKVAICDITMTSASTLRCFSSSLTPLYGWRFQEIHDSSFFHYW